MSWSIKIFRIRGIDIKVHLTFVLILVWAAYRWSSSTGAGWQGALFGVVATLLLFVAVTLHELGHSFQALRYALAVEDVTLMPMGGMARLKEMPEKPVEELRIAIAGPLVNFVIAALLVVLGFVLQTRAIISLDELVHSLGQASWAGMLAYLTTANLAIGLFNLIPAFPMDGGRVLRALLAIKLNYDKATSIAVFVGQGFAWLLGLWGFMSGSWTLVLIAVLVWMGASQEGKQADVKSVLREVKVLQAMIRQPNTLSINDELSDAVELTLSTAQVDFPVIGSHGQLAGLLTEGDLLRGLRAEGGRAPVSRYMHTQFPAAAPQEPLYQAQQRLSESKMQSMPVLDKGGFLAGLLTNADINEAYRLLSASPNLMLLDQQAS